MREPPGPHPRSLRRMPARMQVLVAGAFGALVAVPLSVLLGARFGILLGWDAAAGLYVAGVWLKVWRLDGDQTAALAQDEDPTRATADLLLVSASIVSLVAVAVVLASAAGASGTAQSMRVGLGLASIVLSWGLVHTVFTLLYARLYYYGGDGGVEFNESHRPSYRDFAYLAFTIGMTFQVSDTTITDREIRTTALKHALLSFLFSTVIIATTINLVASLSTK